MRNKHKRHNYPQPVPQGEKPCNGYLPGYVEMICPECRRQYIGGKGSIRCKRCATPQTNQGKT